MNIVHYFFGPERAGGLNKYVRDLALAQQDTGFSVTLLYPGGGWKLKNATRVPQRKWHSLKEWRVANLSPVVLLSGVKNPEQMWQYADQIPAGTANFLNNVRPDVIHIHTWMGFPAALLECVQKTGCLVVDSAHDYFGLCPRVNWIRNDGSICTQGSNDACSRRN